MSWATSSFLTDRLRVPRLAVVESEAIADVPADEVRRCHMLRAHEDIDMLSMCHTAGCYGLRQVSRHSLTASNRFSILGLCADVRGRRVHPRQHSRFADASIVEQFEVLQWRPAVDAMPNAPLFAEMQCDLAASREYDERWLAGAFALVATRPELLVHVFASTDLIDRGILTLRLFKHGAWQPVTIDTMVPCGADGRPSFCCAGDCEVLWPSLLTKAFAKLYGSYAALAGGDLSDALIDLTAGHVAYESMDALKPEPPTDSLPDERELRQRYLDAISRMLSRNAKRGMLQGGLTHPPPDRRPTQASRGVAA